MTWLEIDTWDPQALALIRRAAPCPIASLESVCGRRAFRPFLDAYATDVAIIDVIWNGFLESIKIAAMAEAYEVNCAPHNYYGHLCSAISAHFCAVVPNFRVMEIDIDSVAWRDELFINAPVIEDGELIIPTGPGWGVEVNEAAVRAHPPSGRNRRLTSRLTRKLRHPGHRQRHRRCGGARRRHVPVAPRHAQGRDDADRRRRGGGALRRHAARPGEQRRFGGQYLRRGGGAGRARRLSRQGGGRPAGRRVPPRHRARSACISRRRRWSAARRPRAA